MYVTNLKHQGFFTVNKVILLHKTNLKKNILNYGYKIILFIEK